MQKKKIALKSIKKKYKKQQKMQKKIESIDHWFTIKSQPLGVTAVTAHLWSILFQFACLFLSLFNTMISTICMVDYHYYQQTRPSLIVDIPGPQFSHRLGYLKNKSVNHNKNILLPYLSIERNIKDDLKVKVWIFYTAKEW